MKNKLSKLFYAITLAAGIGGGFYAGHASREAEVNQLWNQNALLAWNGDMLSATLGVATGKTNVVHSDIMQGMKERIENNTLRKEFKGPTGASYCGWLEKIYKEQVELQTKLAPKDGMTR